MVIEFKIPELGENITGGLVASVLVAAGDVIEQDQGLLELETDKAVIEVPSTVAGRVQEVKVEAGQEVTIGQVVFLIEQQKDETSSSQPSKEKEIEKEGKEEAAPEISVAAGQPAEALPDVAPTQEEMAQASVQTERRAAPAAPSTRRFAREIGVDVNNVPGSGPGGRISIEDVKAYSKQINKQRADSQAVLKGVQPEHLPDFAKWGDVERRQMNKIRQTTATHLSYAWATIPHVTQFDKADITNLEKLRKQYAPITEKAGGKLTVTAILLKVVALVLKKFPQFNAGIDMTTKEIIYKKYYNIGVAVDTEHGLLVPVVNNVDQKNITGLAVELNELSAKARERKLSLDDMQGGNFSISNLGGIGGTSFTPIVNSPEVAILGVSRAEMQQVYVDGDFEARLMLPLSLSYDHRLIDGADGARFLRWICRALEEPFLLSLEG